jgi:DNA ligase D-like protein (predicted ligase)
MIAPMLCKTRDPLPSGKQYLYEVKLDGQRTLAEVGKESLLLYTRSLQNVTARYPELKQLCASLRAKKAVLDGEIVALKDGIPSFELLQQRMGLRDMRRLAQVIDQVPVIYYVFDILELDGKTLLKLPLIERKRILRKSVKAGDVIKLLPFFDSLDVVAKALAYGYEGVVAKRRDAPYMPGHRTDHWLKHKFVKEDSFVICGWMEGKRSRFFGALIIGKRSGKELVYAGRVGTGFTEETIRDLLAVFKPLEVSKSPFGKQHKFPEPVHWLKPKLKSRVKYTEWTGAGILRTPVFLSLQS